MSMNDIFNQDVVVSSVVEQVTGNMPDGEVVILNLDAGVYYGMNPVGGRIWELVQQPRSVGEICDILLREYDVAPERCLAEVQALLLQLHKNNLIKIEASAPAG